MDGYDPEALREETRRQLERARVQRDYVRRLHENRDYQLEASNREAWRRYIEAERREIGLRRNGHLRKLLGDPLPGESAEELQRLAEEDRLGAIEGLVEIMDESGQITHTHIDELSPEDWSARIRAEGARIEWLAERRARRAPSSASSAPGHPQEERTP